MSYLAIITVNDVEQHRWYPSCKTEEAAKERLLLECRMLGAEFGEVFECRNVDTIVYNDWTCEYDSIYGEGREDEVR